MSRSGSRVGMAGKCSCGEKGELGREPDRASASVFQRASAAKEAAAPAANPPRGPGHELGQLSVWPKRASGAGGPTGLPRALRLGLEGLAGVGLSRVRVHYESGEPARVGAFAYARGTEIHLGPGQERHLPHEGWHVVQQLAGRVQPTRRAGGLPINDDPGLEREAELKGAEARRRGDGLVGPPFQAGLATADGTPLVDPDDEPFSAATGPAAESADPAARAPEREPVLQRVARFVDGPVNADIKLAKHFLDGGSYAGRTPPTLNGIEIEDAATARAAIGKPSIGTTVNEDGTHTARIESVPTNTGSFFMRLPEGSGPWSSETTTAALAKLFKALNLSVKSGCSRPGSTTLTVRGRPTGSDFAKNLRAHEDLHVADHRQTFTAIVSPWDARLEAARKKGTPFTGASAEAAVAALYRAMLGSPDMVASALSANWLDRAEARHQGAKTLATGGPTLPENSKTSADCTRASFDVR